MEQDIPTSIKSKSIPIPASIEDERMAVLRDYLAAAHYAMNRMEKPIAVELTKRRNSSGYAWRSVELTRQELLCLLLFAQGMDNQAIADKLGISLNVVNMRSGSLRFRLNFPKKKAMIRTLYDIDFLACIPKVLIDELLDEVRRKRLGASSSK